MSLSDDMGDVVARSIDDYLSDEETRIDQLAMKAISKQWGLGSTLRRLSSIGDQPTLEDFNREYSDFPVRLVSRKMSRQWLADPLWGYLTKTGLTKSKLVKTFQAAVRERGIDLQAEATALVFGVASRGLFALHTWRSTAEVPSVDDGYPRLSATLSYTEQSITISLEAFAAVLESVAAVWQPRQDSL